MWVMAMVVREELRSSELDVEGASVEVLIPRLVDLYSQGRFPFDCRVRYYSLEEINRDAEKGEVSKPVLRME